MSNGERYNLSACVFTALTDVECEIDGLLSYDRAVIKMPAQALHQIHSELISSSVALNHNPSGETCCFVRMAQVQHCGLKHDSSPSYATHTFTQRSLAHHFTEATILQTRIIISSLLHSVLQCAL